MAGLRAGAVVVALALWAATPGAQSTPAQPPRSHLGRLFPPQDLGLLEAPDRDAWQRPHQILDALGIAEASVVADVGAGSGWFTVRLARRVGPNGLVYAQDVQPEMLAAITRRIQREGLANVRTRLGRGSDPFLPADTFDAILIVDVVHEIEDRVTLFTNLARALKPDGRIGVVDFKPGGAGPGPDADERVPADTVEAEARRAGLEVKRREAFLPFQYFLIIGPPAATTPPAPAATGPRRGAPPARPTPRRRP
jgi:SAM-dependent methyltransferase